VDSKQISDQKSQSGILPKLACMMLVASFAMILCMELPAGAATINVTASAPDILAIDGSCSLREAITNINNGASINTDCTAGMAPYGTRDTLILPAGTYTNTIASTNEDFNVNGDLDIRRSIIIVGAGAGSTVIDGGGAAMNDHVFLVVSAIVNISGVTIRNGSAASSGGGIVNVGTLAITKSVISGNTALFGGGISNDGRSTLTITNSTISGNTAGGGGGGIANWGMLTITNSTINGNIGNNAGLGFGGGIANNINGTVSITNSTISGNFASGGGGASSEGTLTVTNSTISGNSATTGGGIWNNGVVNLNNTIVANQATGGDCLNFSAGTIPAPLNSLDSDGSCGVGALSNQNPLLGPLANGGGPTLTHALLPGSPAIDAGSSILTTDQRGFVRPVDGDGDTVAVVDIGAFELGPAPVIGLNTNGSSFATGNAMTLTASTTPGATPTNADVYVALQLPDGTLLVMQPDGSFNTTLTPLVANIPVPAFSGIIFSYRFTGAEPVGNYTWFAALTTPGTLNIIGTMAVQPFSFRP